MAMGMYWLWNISGLRAREMSTLLSFLATMPREVQSDLVLMPVALCPSLAPRSHRLSLALLDSPHSMLTPFTLPSQLSSISGRKGSPTFGFCGVQTMPHLHPYPQQPFSLTHALELFLNDILLPGCGGGGGGETPSPGFKLKME